NEHELQGWMTTQIEEFLAKKGKRIIGWDEILACGVSQKAGIMTWHRPKTAIKGAERGNPVVMSLTGHAYFDVAESKLPGEPPTAGWIPPISLEKAYRWHPVPNGLTGSATKNILGASGCIWSDQFLHNARILADKPGEGTAKSEAYIDYLSLPRMAALAEVTWTKQDLRDYGSFTERMQRMFVRYANVGYNFRMPTPLLDIGKRADGSITVAATSPIKGGTVRYSLDGSAPSASSPELDTTVAVARDEIFKTATFAPDGQTHSLTYTYVDGVQKYAMHGKPFGEWKSGQPGNGKPREMTFDATGFINKNGEYLITFLYTKGGQRLDIDGIEVVKNDTRVVAKDIHHGTTGGSHKNNTYKIKIDSYETGASFKVKAQVYGDTGNDSNGVVLIRLIK
ncbi:MAG: family 20 glycosylhydrolase, partial [Verrucomicrobia bacterium]|nr:family 20 glycosylhydrolase [Verrucomicrobiota bacterium]